MMWTVLPVDDEGHNYEWCLTFGNIIIIIKYFIFIIRKSMHIHQFVSNQ
jgi:hypothetical protein